jgi:hypothetical protein
VISQATDWAVGHGIIPRDFPGLVDSVRAGVAGSKVTRAMHRAATLYATLGLYDRARAIDQWILRRDPGNLLAARREIWCLLRQHRYADALESTDAVEAASTGGAAQWRSTVEALIHAEPGDRQRMLSLIPLYRSNHAAIAQLGMSQPKARTARPKRLP